MKNTRFMEVLFSAMENNDEELATQVANDIELAKSGEVVDTDEVVYEGDDAGNVIITDKGTGEQTIAETAGGEEDTYDLYPAEALEGYLHPEGDGVTPGMQAGDIEDVVEDHLGGVPISDIDPSQFGMTVEEEAEAREFSVTTTNHVVQRIFSDQEFCERLFSEVIESEETAVIGDLKVEKSADDDNSVIVTSNATGDQAMVTLEGDEMEVVELESKNFSNEEQYLPMYVVGVDPINHVIVDAPIYDEVSGQELIQRLSEQGVEALQIFESQEEVRDYAAQLIYGLGGGEAIESVEEPEQVEFSEQDVYLTKFYSNCTNYMTKLFSEEVIGVDTAQMEIEDAIDSGEEIENDTEIITPIDANSAVIEDKETGEFTCVTLDGDEMDIKPISEDEAEELTENLVVGEDKEAEEKDFSDIYCNEAETRFFSETEELTNYMIRLYSEEADQDEIEDAIESGEAVENDSEIITPIDAETAVIEDKETGEFTLATIEDEAIEVKPISEDKVEKLMEEAEEKDFSDIYCNEAETRFFSETEELTNYMVRLYSEEADQDEIESAIESGEEIENDSEIITPIDAETAVIEDKETGEFTLATIEDETIDVKPISEDKAEELMEDIVVEEPESDEKAEEDIEAEEKGFSADPIMTKFFNQVVPVAAPAQAPVVVAAPAAGVPVEGEAVIAAPEVEPAPTVEVIEDKAMAAIQSIQEATTAATGAILEAKQAPVEGAEVDLKEAQFSEGDNTGSGTLVSWFNGNL